MGALEERDAQVRPGKARGEMAGRRISEAEGANSIFANYWTIP